MPQTKRTLTVILVVTLLCLIPNAWADVTAVKFGPFTTFTSEYLDLSFNVPTYWGLPMDHNANSNTIVFSEPPNDIRNGRAHAATLTVQVNRMSSKQNLGAAENALSQFFESFHTQFPDVWIENMTTIEVMGQPSACVLYGLEVPMDDTLNETIPLKGRCVVIPNGQNLFMIRSLSPEDGYGLYDAGVMETALTSFADLTAPEDKTPEIFFPPYKTFESKMLGISFDVPAYMGDPGELDVASNFVTFLEPLDDIRSGEALAASLTIQYNVMSSDVALHDAESAMTEFFASFREQFPSQWWRSLSPITAMDEEASHANYGMFVSVDDEDSQDPLYMKGRCVIIPKDNILYLVRFLCPADHFDTYSAGLFERVLQTIAEI